MIIRTSSTSYGHFDPSISRLGARFHDRYNSAKPFPHIVLSDFLDEEILDLCLTEFPSDEAASVGYRRGHENLKFEFKPENLAPPLRSLFYSFNSAPFIGFMESLTGIKGLLGDPYFWGGGLHQVSEGGHLDIHADFNYHDAMRMERRVNVLIYLNRDWREEYGGCLELWDQKMTRCCERVIPSFNTCVIFNTSSNSFHGNPVRVSHPQGTARRSIALYYYTSTWNGTRRVHTTQFKARPDSSDESDVRSRLNELVQDFTPPIVIRAFRKLGRVGFRPDQSLSDGSSDIRDLIGSRRRTSSLD